MTRIYAIHTGSYSDQSWGPVFSTVKRALAYQAAHRADDEIRIEPHVLDDEGDTGPVYPQWLIVFDAAGEVLFSTAEVRELLPYEPLLHKPEILVPPPGNHWYFLDGPGVRERATLVVRDIFAPDLEHAIKFASDNRAMYLANQP